MGRGLGPLQKRILALLEELQPDEYGRAPSITTSVLAWNLLDRNDADAVRQVRRAVYSLEDRGLVVTWYGTNASDEYAIDNWFEYDYGYASGPVYKSPPRRVFVRLPLTEEQKAVRDKQVARGAAILKALGS